jgi:PAS domain S-box-containing protein
MKLRGYFIEEPMKENQRHRLNVAIVGGGYGSGAVMKLIMGDTFRELRMNILGVAIRNPEAPARKYADELGLNITEGYENLYEIKGLDLIIELTGSDKVLEHILKTKPSRVKVMDHVSARLFWEFMQIEEKYRDLYENAPDMYQSTDANGYIVEVNRTQARLLGYAKHDLIGKHITELLTEDSAKVFRERFPKIIEGEKVEDEDREFIRKDGSVLQTSYSSTMVYDQEGNPLMTRCISRDITEKKKMERALKEYTENLERLVEKRSKELVEAQKYTRGLIESSLDALVTFDKDGIITDVNEETVRLTGCGREELIGSLFRNYFTDPKRAAEGVRRSFDEGKVTNYELVMKSKGDKETPVSYNATVYKNEEGQVRGVFAAARDISETKRMVKELEEARAYTRGLIESSLDALVTFDKDGIITDVSEETVRLTGCGREELIGSLFRNYFTDPKRAAEGVRRSFDEGKVTNYELVMKSKAGKETPVSYNATVYKNEEGQVKGVFAAARDMTEVERLQQQLVIAEKHVGIGRLAAGVAHEIKNQLAPTLIEAQRVTDKIESGRRPSYEFILERARAVEEATRSANRITMALLDYARETRPQFVSYDLKDSIEGVLSLHESKCRSSNIELKLERVDVREIYADKRQIEQVLINIIDNAYEAIVSKGESGVISISVKKEGQYAVISIRDTGIGIPKEDQTRIFDPFFTSISPRGSGLGLSISYGIIEKHDGRIDFESEAGTGSIFRVYLPILPIM